MDSFYAVIMAGGVGTRLWPLSRQSYPKQALRLVGQRTMMQHAVDRLAPLLPPQDIYVVTAADHVDVLASQVPEVPRQNFIVEPMGRGTGPAIGLSAAYLAQRNPDAVMAVLTADHFIRDTQRFRAALSAARQVAQAGYLVTLGIRPLSPATGFGYIEQGEPLPEPAGSAGNRSGELQAYRAVRFTEKPDAPTAEAFVRSGCYSWNSGMFVWRLERILGEFERQMPAFAAQLAEVAGSIGRPEHQQVLARVWPQVEKQTIDYGIMEHADRVAVIPVEMGWTDIGSWSALMEVTETDANGNVVIGDHVGIDTHDCLIYGGQRLVATIGLEDVIIVDTPDALLVCHREQEQTVRELVRQLERDGRSDVL